MCILSDREKTRNNLTDDSKVQCEHCNKIDDPVNMYSIDGMDICSLDCIIIVYEIKTRLARILMGEILKGE